MVYKWRQEAQCIFVTIATDLYIFYND